VVTMPQDILFDTGSAKLRPRLRQSLRKLAANLKRHPNTTIRVLGHTDNTGSAGFNQNLSAKRARAVAGVLIRSGVQSSRIRAIGRGEDQPIATNQTAAGRHQNRRVEIVIRPIS